MLSSPMPQPGMPHPCSLIAGSLVYLRHPVAEDETEFVALRLASRELHEPWEATPEDALPDFDPFGETGFHRLLTTSNTPQSHRHLICRHEDHAIVGQVSLGGIQRGPLMQAFIGYWCGSGFDRRGYTIEGVALAISRAFGALKLHRVEINIIPENGPSISLMDRLGARKEGLSPRYLRIRGAWRDHERWALTREEWDMVSHSVVPG